MFLGWILAIIFICLYLDSKSKISYLKDRINNINAKYNKLLDEKNFNQQVNFAPNREQQNNNQQSNFAPNREQQNNNQQVNFAPNREQQNYNQQVNFAPNREQQNYNQQVNFAPNREQQNYNQHANYATNKYQQNVVNEEIMQKRAQKESEQKNTAILVTGASLIVIAAIVFLSSTWYVISAPIKIAVLFLLLFVFYFASKIAKNKLHLPKASAAFFYISMAYLPICLCAISMLKLLGNYFSLNGDGQFIYFMLCSVITGTVYYFNYLKNKSKKLYVGSLVCGLGSVILFSLIFSNSITLIITLVLIYNIIQQILFKIIRQDINKIHKSFLIVTSFACFGYYILFVLSHYDITSFISENYWKLDGVLSLIPTLNDNTFPIFIVIAILGAINAVLMYLDDKKDFLIVPYYLFTYIIPFITLCELINSKMEIMFVTGITALTLFAVKIINLVIFKFVKSENDNLSLIDYIIYLIGNVLLYFYVIYYNLSFYKESLFLFAIMLVILITLVIINKKYKISSFDVLIPVAFSIAIINLINYFIKDVSLLFRINCYSIYSILLLALGIIFNSKAKSKVFGNTFLAISGILSFVSVFLGLALNIFEKHLMLLPALVISTAIIGYIYCTNRKLEFLRGFLFFLAFYILIFAFDLIPNIERNIQYATSGLVVGFGITLYSLSKKKVSFDVAFSLLAVLCAIIYIDNMYVRFLLALIWELAYLFSTDNSSIKNLFKGLVYITSYLLFVATLNDFGLQKYLFLYIIGLYITAILFSKTIFNKYENNEYIILGVLYLISLFLYHNSIIDGVICVSFMFATLIFSYFKGYGALFVCTLISIIVNILLLTRELWFSMPWWVYLLTVGIILIVFAMRNESHEKKKNLEIKNTLLNLQEKIDKKVQ